MNIAMHARVTVANGRTVYRVIGVASSGPADADTLDGGEAA